VRLEKTAVQLMKNWKSLDDIYNGLTLMGKVKSSSGSIYLLDLVFHTRCFEATTEVICMHSEVLRIVELSVCSCYGVTEGEGSP